ncbi:stage II sporulation protein M [Thermoanaerobacterium sp. DL9XJH110]|uniref:stage II sporulation protein M n=1 Tax=Thermoanaerobacterium sp. DL9XJH110 TaxID=3386643 RepID=UPI003BB71466
MNYFPRLLTDYFKKNIGLYALLSAVFISGIVFGSVEVNMMSENQMKDLLDFINGFFANIKNIDVDSSTIFYISMSNNLKTALALCVLGLTVIGLPLILALIFFRGFVLGFTVGFFIGELGIKGIIFSLLSILPQNIIIIPAILSMGVAGITFSITVLKNRRKLPSENYTQLLMGYMLFNLTFSIMLVLAGLIEGYVSPLFIKMLTQYV